MNHAYGVKHYVLHEEAVLPSVGYGDAIMRMNKFGINNMAPWSTAVNWNMKTRNVKDM